MKFVLDLVVSSLILLLVAQLLPGFQLASFWAALTVAFVISVLNFFVRPVLLFLTLPINVLTLGLFTFVVSAFILEMAAGLLGGFQISGFGTALMAAILIAVFSQFIRVVTHVK